MFVLLLLLFGCCTAVVVETNYGKVKGYPFITRSQRQVLEFSGIPYAAPPPGELRFQDPQPPKRWHGIRDVRMSTMCLQIPDGVNTPTGDEDCLHLTVYTPSINTTALYPVIVHIHGGAFVTGAGQALYGSHYIMDYDVVVVQVEYRLGVFGFLAMEDKMMPGNAGLKDQVLALKWVQDNIEKFRGDANRVTLMGESAGGVSVHYHLISPMSRGLFHGGISESGTTMAPWAYSPPGNMRTIALKAAESLNCKSEDIHETVKCLQARNAKDIILSFNTREFTDLGNKLLIFLPVIDSYSSEPFLPSNPRDMVSAAVPWLSGCDNIDGFLISSSFPASYPRVNLYSQLDTDFNQMAPQLLYYADSDKKAEISEAVKRFYFDNKPITTESLLNITNMFSDRYFFRPLMEALKRHSGPSYVYNYAYNGSVTLQNFFANLPKGERLLDGAVHVDEALLLWKLQYDSQDLDETSVQLSERLVQLFVNFVIHGNPTPRGSEFEWPLWHPITQPFVTVTYDGNFVVDHQFYSKRMDFWTSLEKFDPVI